MGRHRTGQTGYAKNGTCVEASHSWPQEPLSLTLSWYAVGRILGSCIGIPPKEWTFLCVFHHNQSPCISPWYPSIGGSAWWLKGSWECQKLRKFGKSERKVKGFVFHKLKFMPRICRTFTYHSPTRKRRVLVRIAWEPSDKRRTPFNTSLLDMQPLRLQCFTFCLLFIHVFLTHLRLTLYKYFLYACSLCAIYCLSVC
jgi:hypothetical protein